MKAQSNLKKIKTWKVGEIAKETGVTVRTLHHYEEIDLLKPSSRSESGHRVYSESDLEKLQQILSLKQLGFPLEEIGKLLTGKTYSPLQIVRMHQSRVQQEREELGKLYDQLSALERTLATNGQPSVRELFKTIEVITMHDKYFTKEQLTELKQKREAFGESKMEEYQQKWPLLMDQVRSAMNADTDPFSPEIQKLAKEWNTLVQAFTGGNAKIEVQLASMYRNESSMREKFGLDPQMWEYVAKMMGFFHKTRT